MYSISFSEYLFGLFSDGDWALGKGSERSACAEASLSTSAGSWPLLWIFFQQFSLRQPHARTIFPPGPVSLGGVNQCKLDTGQT